MRSVDTCFKARASVTIPVARSISDQSSAAISDRRAPVPAAIVTGGFSRLTLPLFVAAIGVALLSSAIPYTLEMIALKELPARTFGILMSLEPAVAALAGLVFLHEVLSPPQWLAVALVIAASTGSTLTSRRAEKAAEGESGEGWQGG